MGGILSKPKIPGPAPEEIKAKEDAIASSSRTKSNASRINKRKKTVRR